MQKFFLLLLRQIINSIVFAKKRNKIEVRKLFIKLLHFGFINIQNDSRVSGCVILRSMCHMDQICIHQDQAAFFHLIGTVVEEKEALSFCEKVNLVFIMKMIGTHIKTTGTF